MGSVRLLAVAAIALKVAFAVPADAATSCDKPCLEGLGDKYLAAYLKHDPSPLPISGAVRFSENGVMMKFPDASWDTVTQEIGTPLIFSDPKTGGVGIYAAIMQNDTPGFLAVRLKVTDGKIAEIEHVVSTRRTLSGPPTPFGDVNKPFYDPAMSRTLSAAERTPRAQMIELADGYFSTLAQNDGTIRTKFRPDCHRLENGMETAANGCETGFKLGNYRFNERVRDRDYLVIDEERGLVMVRAYIDHKGILDNYKLTDGTDKRSPFREPHTWSVMETFQVEAGGLGPIITTFIGSPYYVRSLWTKTSGTP